eukprot:9273596-Prorocentrum_lima.AAC.1
MFRKLSSNPPTDACKAADLYAPVPGHDVEHADATQVFKQSKLVGPPTWIRLPRDRWPEA